MLDSKVLVVFILLFCCFLQSRAADKPPNILVMLMDDVCNMLYV